MGREVAGYEVVDCKTRAVIKAFKPFEFRRARNRADKLDQEYGAVRYIVVPIWADASPKAQS